MRQNNHISKIKNKKADVSVKIWVMSRFRLVQTIALLPIKDLWNCKNVTLKVNYLLFTRKWTWKCSSHLTEEQTRGRIFYLSVMWKSLNTFTRCRDALKCLLHWDSGRNWSKMTAVSCTEGSWPEPGAHLSDWFTWSYCVQLSRETFGVVFYSLHHEIRWLWLEKEKNKTCSKHGFCYTGHLK